MKKLLIAVFGLLAATLLATSAAAVSGSPPHNDYRIDGTPGTGYKPSGTCDGLACHSNIYTQARFLANGFGTNTNPPNDFTSFCLGCHNATGEAHEKSAGSPSTNAYDHMTTLIPGDYRGVSHSWNGLNGNAATRTPDPLSGIAGTTNMPGGKVRCQTCHDGMNKTAEDNIIWAQATNPSNDHKNFVLSSGYPSTKQYLSQYLKVYRYPTALASPTESRTKKNYLVNYTAYTYNNQTQTITFTTAQGATANVYADITQPYLREGDAANAMCVDCHNNRVSSRVRHGSADSPGMDNHPAGAPLAKVFGSHTTLRNVTGIKLYTEGGTVLCTSCHDVHNAAGNTGSLLREADPSKLCLDCHSASKVAPHKGKRHPKFANGSTIPTGCTECHGAHRTGNIYLVREKVKAPSGSVRGVRFLNFTGPSSFGNDSGGSLCEVCHTGTSFHRSDGVTGTGHNTRKNCTTCHKHERGFAASGGSAPCYGCHDGTTGPDIKSLMGLGTSFANGGKSSRHMIAFDNQSSSSCLAMCHTSDHKTDQPNLKTTPELDLCNQASCHNGGTQTTSRGRSISVGGRFAASMHNFTATMSDEFGLFRYQGNCTKCHGPHGSDDYPNVRREVNGRTTGGNTNELCFGCHNGAIFKGASDIERPWKANPANRGHYDYAAGKQFDCVRCHGPHGTGNSRMINDSLGGPGLTRDAVCRACHSGTGGSVYNVMGTAPGSYGPDFSAGSVHTFGLGVAPNGRSVDLTCTGCHDPHNTTNARLLRQSVLFSGTSSVAIPTVSASVQPQGPVTAYTAGWVSYCTTCHTSIKDTGGQSPYRRHPVNIAPGAFYPHTSGLGVRTLPVESGNVSCVTCHFTHGSPKQKLLRMDSAATPDSNLCLQCHDRSRFSQGGLGSHGGFVQNQGRCSDCHNMHDLANKRLLVESTESVLCKRCHSEGGISRFNVWKTYTTTADYMRLKGTGGTFGRYSEVRGGTAHSIHAVNDEATAAPGGVTTQHRCGSCHNPHGSTNYRVLRSTVNNVTGITVNARLDENGDFVNYSTGFVKFCTACHADYKTTKDDNGNWIRHPVGVSLKDYSSQRTFFRNSTSYKPKVELESGETIACVSCHFAHGSGADANLKFPGGRSVNACKTCHNRDAFSAGTPGSHAGFAGNDGTCSDCHSMHKDGNRKLLKDDAETAICVNCHDNPGTSTSPNASHLDVWRGNTFDSPTSWVGTAGSFGTYDPVNGGNAFSMHPINSDARVAPGDGATVVHCGTCHDTHGGGNYRLLKKSLNGKSGIIVTATVDANGRTVAHGSGMSSFCTACHKAYLQYGSAAGYTRHPVDVALTDAELANYNHFNGAKYLPLEAGNKVTCITCHFAHGSPNDNMKRLPGNQMCQTCHAKGLDPAAGYGDVMYTHGGFSGNAGDCSVCHSMHSKNNRKLLVVAEETQLCYGCHGPDGPRRGSFPQAQLVWKGDSPGTPDAWDGTAGSFGAFYNQTTGGSISSHHSITRTDSAAPGGTTTEHRCGTCHNPHGSNNYRLLRDTVNGKAGISVKVGRFGNYSAGMTDFCTACHVTYGEPGSGVNGYQRHPAAIALTAAEYTNLSGTASQPKAPLEGRRVICLSCHYAHGSPSYKMLRMQNVTSSESELCQQCHKKGFNQDGQQVRYGHGGFIGNRGNCKVCHSVHAKNNRKLLMEAKEANLCENCHSGIAKFNTFKAGEPGVKITAPSRFNVFSSIGNSFGNYSVGGGGVKSWHEVDGTHTAPGGLTLELRCGKCHNPHGGDNFVMLRDTVEGKTNIKVFGHVSSTGPFNTYSSGFGSFCSACHTRLTTCLSVVNNVTTITRHPVDFRLQRKQLHNWSTTPITPRVPLEAGSQVTCITCHNSHGSKNYSLQRLGGNYMCQQCHKR